MPNVRSLWCILVYFFILSFHSAYSIKCYRCYPPMDRETCKRTSDAIDCRIFKPLGYDSCVKVDYHGNNTMTKTCYRGFLCEEARTWCRRYGPCTVSCCKDNMCNASNVTRFTTSLVTFSVLWIFVTL